MKNREHKMAELNDDHLEKVAGGNGVAPKDLDGALKDAMDGASGSADRIGSHLKPTITRFEA